MTTDNPPAETHSTYRFTLKKRDMRVRFENESEEEVTVIIEPVEEHPK